MDRKAICLLLLMLLPPVLMRVAPLRSQPAAPTSSGEILIRFLMSAHYFHFSAGIEPLRDGRRNALVVAARSQLPAAQPATITSQVAR